MDLTKDEIEELQEQLILIYKFISQNRMFKKFYYEGIKFYEPFEKENNLISKFNEVEDAEDILRSCIMELEEEKKGEDFKNQVYFHEIILSYDLGSLYKKYGMKNPQDIGKLDIKRFLRFL